jgi:hypothetical protein
MISLAVEALFFMSKELNYQILYKKISAFKMLNFVQLLMKLNKKRCRTDPTAHSKRTRRDITAVFLKVW